MRFSIDDLFTIEGELSRCSAGLLFSRFNRLGDAGSRLCQYRRGELDTNGDVSNGDGSVAKIAF